LGQSTIILDFNFPFLSLVCSCKVLGAAQVVYLERPLRKGSIIVFNLGGAEVNRMC